MAISSNLISSPQAPYDIKVLALDGQALLYWTRPYDIGGAPLAEYVVTYNPGNHKVHISEKATSVVIPLANGVTYFIFVQAVNTAGLLSEPSTGVLVKPVSQNSVGTIVTSYPQRYFTTYENVSLPGIVGFVNMIRGDVQAEAISGLYNEAHGIFAPPNGHNHNPASVFKDTYPLLDGATTDTFCASIIYRKYSPVINTQTSVTTYGRPLATSNDISTTALETIYVLLAEEFGITVLATKAYISADNIRAIITAGASISDVVKLYRDYYEYKTTLGDAFTSFARTEDGNGGAAVARWANNLIPLSPATYAAAFPAGWSYSYSVSIPILQFDTDYGTGIPVKAFLRLKRTANSTINKKDNYKLQVRKFLGDTTNLSAADYTNIDTTVIAEFDPIDISLEESYVVVPIPVASLTNGVTAFALVSSLQTQGVLPTGWNQVWFDAATLQIEFSAVVDGAPVSRPLAPDPPRNVTIGLSSSQASLSWGVPASNNGSGITGYLLENATKQESFVIPAYQQSFTFVFLVPQTAYQFHVSAINAVGVSPATFISGTTLGTGSSETDPSTGVGSSYFPPSAPINTIASAANEAAVLTWDAPVSDGGKSILQYVITEVEHGITKILSAADTGQGLLDFTNRATTIRGLVNVTEAYVFSIAAVNIQGASPETLFNTVVPTAVTHGADAPVNVQALLGGPSGNDIVITWTNPVNTGGGIIIGYRIRLYDVITGVEVNYVSTQLGASYVLSNSNGQFANDKVYYFNVSLITRDNLSTYYGAIGVSNLLTITTDRVITFLSNVNYKRFFTAPVFLDRRKEEYLDFIYPAAVYEDSPSYIVGEAGHWPVTISNTNDQLIIRYGETKFYLTIPVRAIPYNVEEIISILQETKDASVVDAGSSETPSVFNEVTRIVNIRGRIGIEEVRATTTAAYRGLTLDNIDVYNNEVFTLAHNTLFGNVEIIAATTRQVVKEHVPTKEHDALNEQALIEAKPWVSVREKNVITYPYSVEEVSSSGEFPFYTVNLPHHYIRPGSVSLTWYNSANNLLVIRDYFADGRLLQKVVTKDPDTDVVTHTYYPDRTALTSYFGKVNYETGEITEVSLFPNGKIQDFAVPIIFGSGIKYPVTFTLPNNLFLTVNGIARAYKINAGIYTLQQLVDYLNNVDGNAPHNFKTDGLYAEIRLNSLALANIASPGPNKTLVLTGINVYDNANNKVLGPSPVTKKASFLNVNYAYGLYTADKYKYIWYQTPHFVLRLKNDTSQFFTKAHLDYFLTKIPLIKPAETVLNSIDLRSVVKDTVVINDYVVVTSFDILPPYLQVTKVVDSNGGPPPAEYKGTYRSVEVINPDGQVSNILEDAYLFL